MSKKPNQNNYFLSVKENRALLKQWKMWVVQKVGVLEIPESIFWDSIHMVQG